MKTSASTNLDNELWTLLNQAQHVLERVREKELKEIGISAIQADVLSSVKTSKAPMTPAKLARLLFREPHTISGLLTRMESQGLVKKTKNLHRKNMVRISLTPKGEEAYRKQQQIEAKAISDSLACLSPKEKDLLTGFLQRVKAAGLGEFRQRLRLPYE